MPLPSPPNSISLNQIHVEAGGSSGTLASLNDSDIRGLIGKSSGATNSFSEYYGASAEQPITLTISSNQQGYDVRAKAVAAGWDQLGAVTVNINSGVYVWSDETSSPALTISGSFPAGVRINNYGYIMGRGGDDPQLSKWSDTGSYTPQSANGGSAIYISSSNVTIDNKSSGFILGGGGAGAWASDITAINTPTNSGGGGAGGGSGAYLGAPYNPTKRSAGGAVGQNGGGNIYAGISSNSWPSANVAYATTVAGGGGAGGHGIANPNNSNYFAASGGMGGGRKVPTGDTGGRSIRITINNVQYEGGQGGSAGVNGGDGVIATGGYTSSSGGGGGGYGARGGRGWRSNTYYSNYGNAGKAIEKTTTYTLTGSTSRIYGAT